MLSHISAGLFYMHIHTIIYFQLPPISCDIIYCTCLINHWLQDLTRWARYKTDIKLIWFKFKQSVNRVGSIQSNIAMIMIWMKTLKITEPTNTKTLFIDLMHTSPFVNKTNHALAGICYGSIHIHTQAKCEHHK